MKYRPEFVPTPGRIARTVAAIGDRPASLALWERARAVLPGGVPALGSVTVPVYWDRGDGAFMYDVDGRRYLDMAAGQASLGSPGAIVMYTGQAQANSFVKAARQQGTP